MNNSNQQQDMIDDQAIQWIVRLGACSLNPQEQYLFDEWLAASDHHQRAFLKAQQTWALMGQLSIAELTPSPEKADLMTRWRPLGAIAAVLCVIVLASFFGTDAGQVRLYADHQTLTGERRTISLSDGSQIDLGPRSAISIEYSDDRRGIRLLTGAAYFDVSPMNAREQRPFVVKTTKGRVRALGTEFMVQELANTVEVVVAEHSVEVTASKGFPKQVLVEGQQMRYSETFTPVAPANVALMTAWRRERLIFDHMPLDDVANILNRYTSKRILITDADLAQRRVSGVFMTNDPDQILATIASELQLTVIDKLPFIILLQP